MAALTDYPFEVRSLEQDDGGCFLVSFPDFTECISDGETIEEALENGRGALKATIAALKARKLPVPAPNSGGAAFGKFVAMQSMNISLPDPLKRFVDGQIATGRYGTASEYVRELIRADEKRKAEAELEARLLEGLNGTEVELTAAEWGDIRKEVLARVAARKAKR